MSAAARPAALRSAVPAWAGLLRRMAPAGGLALLASLAAGPAAAEPPSAQRQQQLLRMVRQDCGACHGLQLTGGLGPAITPAVLAERGGVELVYATIWHGRAGTPMPPWRGLLTEPEVRWMSQRLVEGLPAGGQP